MFAFPRLVAFAMACSLLLATPALAVGTLAVISADPLPNYRDKGDKFNFDSLSDGKTRNKSMWVKAGSAAWVKPIPIVLDVSISHPPVDAVVSALRFHFGAREKAGVYLPVSIDVYSVDGSTNAAATAKYTHIGEWRSDQFRLDFSVSATATDIKDRNRAEWIRVPLDSVSENLMVVVHPGGKVLALDEVSLDTVIASEGVEANSQKSRNVSVVEPRADSYARLMQLSDQRLHNQRADNVGIGIVQPFYALNAPISTVRSLKENSSFFTDDHSALTLVVDGIDEEQCISVKAQAGLEVKQIIPVFSVHGNRVYDVVRPLDGCVSIESGYSAYLLVRPDESAVADSSAGSESSGEQAVSHKIELSDRQGDVLFSERVKFRSQLDAVRNTDQCINVAPYSYSNEYPAWNNKADMFGRLESAGVNTFFIPPRHFPFIDELDKKHIVAKRLEDFRADLHLYKNAKNIIFVAGLDRKLDWNMPAKEMDTKINRWLALIERELVSAGSSARFLIQPIDEIYGQDWERVDRFATIVEQRASKNSVAQIGVYLNPIYKRRDPTRAHYLARLRSKVAVWQPNKRFVSRVPREQYLGEAGELWFYHNPAYPPKEASPDFYAQLIDFAADNQLTGVGFWSATSTKKSSLWDDTDGVQPDYGLFYEEDGQLFPSLRWLAFVDRLGKHCAATLTGSGGGV